MMEEISVLMSIYIKEKVPYFIECVESLLSQTYMPNEIVIIKDGPLYPELDKCINKYREKFPDLFRIYQLEKNLGLGQALRYGITKCKNEFIARMDTDDVCRADRFQKQIEEFRKNKNLKICGSYISEFDDDINNIISIRKVPLVHENIMKYQRRRSAFNHVTVMFKKSAVIEAGNYEHALYMEDDVLWARMLICNMNSMNIDESLVYVRTGIEMIRRRGGWNYLQCYKTARKLMHNIGFISYTDYLITVGLQLVVCIIPKSMRIWFFKNVLRR
ncbi:glycosyltransferase [[Clostridium] innocuum]|uniref:glycosyltransferase n=1 Tax=Clostridium innocuum TaxID=1522 RepID=UPI001EDE7D54|nr:glycosyltransferase [[Clostridium] innocuum]MCG4662737.1 glycosyltransferase [[Clostridium] innocuum]MCR0332742.1 glycosyltransferase [[Clostridium] innocuum]